MREQTRIERYNPSATSLSTTSNRQIKRRPHMQRPGQKPSNPSCVSPGWSTRHRDLWQPSPDRRLHPALADLSGLFASPDFSCKTSTKTRVSFQIMSNQLNSSQMDSNQGAKTTMGTEQRFPRLRLGCHNRRPPKVSANGKIKPPALIQTSLLLNTLCVFTHYLGHRFQARSSASSKSAPAAKIIATLVHIQVGCLSSVLVHLDLPCIRREEGTLVSSVTASADESDSIPISVFKRLLQTFKSALSYFGCCGDRKVVGLTPRAPEAAAAAREHTQTCTLSLLMQPWRKPE